MFLPFDGESRDETHSNPTHSNKKKNRFYLRIYDASRYRARYRARNSRESSAVISQSRNLLQPLERDPLR